MSPKLNFGELKSKETKKESDNSDTLDDMFEEEDVQTPQKPKKTKKTTKTTPKSTPKPRPKNIKVFQDQFIPSFVMLLNGSAGSGKSTMADLFPKPFILDLEHGKNTDMAPYSSYEKIQNLQSGTIEDLRAGKDFDIIDLQEKDKTETWNNIKEVLEWYIDKGYKTHQTLVIDTAYWLRSTRTKVEERKKGKDKLMWYEYAPVTEAIQVVLYDLLRDLRTLKRNLILITHWQAKYESYKDEKGMPQSHVVGRVPDVKEWILDASTWIVNFLKPEESGYKGKYIVYFDKAPRFQYKSIDITDKNLFEIINDLDSFENAVKEFETLEEERSNNALDEAFE